MWRSRRYGSARSPTQTRQITGPTGRDGSRLVLGDNRAVPMVSAGTSCVEAGWPDHRSMSTLRSTAVTQGLERAPHRAQLRATGLGEAALARPFIGVVHTYGEVSPCSQSIAAQVQAAKLGVEVGGATAREFATISVSDVLSQLRDGMRFSLMSRDAIAD